MTDGDAHTSSHRERETQEGGREIKLCHIASLCVYNWFLKNRHLPAYLVASFSKRVARLCLFAPPAAILESLPFVYNLLVRHPSCHRLLHASASLGILLT